MCTNSTFFFEEIISTMTFDDLDFTWSSYTGWNNDDDDQECCNDLTCEKKCNGKKCIEDNKNDNKNRKNCYICGKENAIIRGDMGSIWHYCKKCKV